MDDLSRRAVTTSSVAKISAIGLGTFEPGAAGRGRFARAVKGGFSLDIATLIQQLYGCEEEVGKGIHASGIPREELFIYTKFSIITPMT